MRRQPAQAGAAGSSKEEVGRFKKNKLKGSFGDAGSFLPLVRQVDKSEEEAWTGRRWQEAVFLPLAQAQTLGGLNALGRRYRCNSNSFLGSLKSCCIWTLLALYLFVCMLTVYVALKRILATQLNVPLIAIKANSIMLHTFMLSNVSYRAVVIVA